MDEQPQLLSVRAAAELLGQHPVSIRRHIKRGELRALRIGERGPLRIPEDELRRLLHPGGDAMSAFADLLEMFRNTTGRPPTDAELRRLFAALTETELPR